MTKHIVGVSIDTSVDSARKLMNSMHVEIIPVLSDGKLSGIVVDSDLKDVEGAETVGAVMRRPVFVEEEADAKNAAKQMVENAFSRIPVVNNAKDMHCVGVINSTDVVKSLK